MRMLCIVFFLLILSATVWGEERVKTDRNSEQDMFLSDEQKRDYYEQVLKERRKKFHEMNKRREGYEKGAIDAKDRDEQIAEYRNFLRQVETKSDMEKWKEIQEKKIKMLEDIASGRGVNPREAIKLKLEEKRLRSKYKTPMDETSIDDRLREIERKQRDLEWKQSEMEWKQQLR